MIAWQYAILSQISQALLLHLKPPLNLLDRVPRYLITWELLEGVLMNQLLHLFLIFDVKHLVHFLHLHVQPTLLEQELLYLHIMVVKRLESLLFQVFFQSFQVLLVGLLGFLKLDGQRGS